MSSEGTIMVPVRDVFESAGILVDWDAQEKQIQIGENAYLTMDTINPKIIMDGVSFETSYLPIIKDNLSYLPLNFFIEYLNFIADDSSLTIPDHLQISLQNDLKNKLELYQTSLDGESAFLNALNPNTGWIFAKELGEIGSSIDGLGFRGAGTAAGKEAADLVYSKFKDLGLNPKYYDFPVYGWNYVDSSLTITEKPELIIPTVGAPGAKGTNEEGITGELVFVGTGSKQDLEGVDLTGKIAVMALDMDYIPWYAQAAYQVELHGAEGLIYYCVNYYGQDESGEAFSVADWSGPEADIPVLNTPKKYGEALKEMLAEETLTGTLISNSEINENATGYNVVGTIIGSKYPDEYVIVDAHTDAYFYGFQDDSLAIGAMVSFAEAIKNSGYKPDRTLVFVSCDAEEFGAIDVGTDWLIGSWNLLKEKSSEWSGKTVGNLTLELMAYSESENLEMRSSDTLYDFISTLMGNQQFNAFKDSVVHNYVSTWSDEFSFSYHGIPTFRTHTDPNVTENFYHSQFDTEERASIEKYTECLQNYGKLLVKLDKMPVAPYDLSITPLSYLDSLDQDALTTLGYDSSLYDSVRAYHAQTKELNAKNLLIAKLIDKAQSEGKDLDAVYELLNKYNQGLRDTAKTIIIGTQYLNGEDVDFQLPYYTGLPSTFDNAIAALKVGNANEAISALKVGGKYYSEFLDKETWYKTYQDSISLNNPSREIFWAQGRKLKYYDHYDLFESLRAKAENGSTDFESEIKALESFKADALGRLATAYELDKGVFEKALKELPLDLADELIDSLK